MLLEDYGPSFKLWASYDDNPHRFTLIGKSLNLIDIAAIASSQKNAARIICDILQHGRPIGTIKADHSMEFHNFNLMLSDKEMKEIIRMWNRALDKKTCI